MSSPSQECNAMISRRLLFRGKNYEIDNIFVADLILGNMVLVHSEEEN